MTTDHHAESYFDEPRLGMPDRVAQQGAFCAGPSQSAAAGWLCAMAAVDCAAAVMPLKRVDPLLCAWTTAGVVDVVSCSTQGEATLPEAGDTLLSPTTLRLDG